MDKEDGVSISGGKRLSHTRERSLATGHDVDGARDYNSQQTKSVRERAVPCDFTDRCHWRSETHEQSEGDGDGPWATVGHAGLNVGVHGSLRICVLVSWSLGEGGEDPAV